jgi:hypothetical protein
MSQLHSFISDYIQEFGPRRAGSEAETRAQQRFKSQLDEICTHAEEQPFRAALRGKFDALKATSLLYWGSLVLYWFWPTVALAVAVVNAIVLALNFVLYVHILDPLYRKRTSRNVVGTLEPNSDVRHTVILSGHMDSTPEFIWWYWLGHWGGPVTVLAVAQQLLWPVALGLSMAVSSSLPSSGLFAGANSVWWFFAALSPLVITLFFIHGRRVVPGAQDNLSGVAVAYGVAKSFAQPTKTDADKPAHSRLRHVRVMVVSFGAEESGLRGSRAFARANRHRLDPANTHFVNMDGIMEEDQMHVITLEPSRRKRYHRDVVHRVKNHLDQQGTVPARLKVLPIGATDGAELAAVGLRGTTIVGFGLKRLHPTYHTRRDVPEWVQPAALERTHRALVSYIQELDEELAKPTH